VQGPRGRTWPAPGSIHLDKSGFRQEDIPNGTEDFPNNCPEAEINPRKRPRPSCPRPRPSRISRDLAQTSALSVPQRSGCHRSISIPRLRPCSLSRPIPLLEELETGMNLCVKTWRASDPGAVPVQARMRPVRFPSARQIRVRIQPGTLLFAEALEFLLKLLEPLSKKNLRPASLKSCPLKGMTAAESTRPEGRRAHHRGAREDPSIFLQAYPGLPEGISRHGWSNTDREIAVTGPARAAESARAATASASRSRKRWAHFPRSPMPSCRGAKSDAGVCRSCAATGLDGPLGCGRRKPASGMPADPI